MVLIRTSVAERYSENVLQRELHYARWSIRRRTGGSSLAGDPQWRSRIVRDRAERVRRHAQLRVAMPETVRDVERFAANFDPLTLGDPDLHLEGIVPLLES